MANRLLYVALRDLYLRFPCTCEGMWTCVGCHLRKALGPTETNAPLHPNEIDKVTPYMGRPPFETFKGATC